MNAKGLFLVSSLEVEVLAVIVGVWELVVKQGFLCAWKVKSEKRRRWEESIMEVFIELFSFPIADIWHTRVNVRHFMI